MALLGMPDAAKRIGVSSGNTARRALQNAGVPLVEINKRAMAVEESDLEAFIEARAGYSGFGRPKKSEKATPSQADASQRSAE
jgi:hypothetical protein